MKRGRTSLPVTVINVSLVLFFAFCVVCPIISMLSRITPSGFLEVVRSEQFLPAVKNSLVTALTATVISVLLSLLAALAIYRTRLRAGGFFAALFVLPMLIPSISHAFGLVALFGKNGIITNLLGLEGGIYGFAGIVTGSVLYSFPVAFLMFSAILRYEDGMTYRAAEVLGIPAWGRFWGITLPYLKKTLISAFFAVFTMIVTDYGVPLMVGGRMTTLSVLMYNRAVGMIDYDSGSVIGAFLLLPAVAAFLVDVLTPDRGQSGFVSEPVMPKRAPARDAAACVFCAVLGICVLLPVLVFIVMLFETKYPVDPTPTLYHIKRTIERGADGFLMNSLLYSVLAAALGTALSFVCAYMTSRVRGAFSRWVHLFSILSMAIPGIVLGLSYVIFFHGSPVYGTVFIVAMVNSMHFFSSPYLMMYNTLAKVNPNLEAVGMTLGVGRLRVVRDVILPKVRYTLCEMFVYFFVNSMMTISAVSFLAPPAPKPVALMINQFEAQRLMESAAFVSLLILIINVTLKAALGAIRRRGERKEAL